MYTKPKASCNHTQLPVLLLLIPSLCVWLWSHYQIKHGRATVEYGQEGEECCVMLCCK